LIVNAKFTDTSDADYLPSDDSLPALPLPNEKTYSVFTSSLAGFSNTGTATVKLDFGVGFTAQLCEYDPGDLNGNGIEDDDVDRDSVCDSWETSGIPYTFGGPSFFFPLDDPCPTCAGVDITTPAGNLANILDEEAFLTGTQVSNDLTPVIGKRDYYLEIDAMDLHPADVKAINDVIILWADLGPGPAAPHDAIDGVVYPVQPANNDGVALHVSVNFALTIKLLALVF